MPSCHLTTLAKSLFIQRRSRRVNKRWFQCGHAMQGGVGLTCMPAMPSHHGSLPDSLLWLPEWCLGVCNCIIKASICAARQSKQLRICLFSILIWRLVWQAGKCLMLGCHHFCFMGKCGSHCLIVQSAIGGQGFKEDFVTFFFWPMAVLTVDSESFKDSSLIWVIFHVGDGGFGCHPVQVISVHVGQV